MTSSSSFLTAPTHHAAAGLHVAFEAACQRDGIVHVEDDILFEAMEEASAVEIKGKTLTIMSESGATLLGDNSVSSNKGGANWLTELATFHDFESSTRATAMPAGS